MPSTQEILPDKAYAVVALSFAGRGVQLGKTKFLDLSMTTNENTGENCSQLNIKRTKRSGMERSIETLDHRGGSRFFDLMWTHSRC